MTQKAVGVSEKKKLVASMATVGTPLGLKKNKPTPLAMLNPYINIDPVAGTVLPNPKWDDIISSTDKILDNIVLSDAIQVPNSEVDEPQELDEFEEDELLDDDSVEEPIDMD